MMAVQSFCSQWMTMFQNHDLVSHEPFGQMQGVFHPLALQQVVQTGFEFS